MMTQIKKVLLTGANGMVGRNISDIAPKHVELLTPSRKELNLLDYKNCETYIALHQPDIIIHAAGVVGGIQANMTYPVKFLVENTRMGENIVLASQKNQVKYMINLGSSCMYPKDYKNPLKEDYLFDAKLEPTNEGYAIAKLYTQRLCEYVMKEDDSFKYMTLIPCNLYGKYDKFDPLFAHMIPSAIRKVYEAKVNNKASVEIWGDGTARREFMYAGDFADLLWYTVAHINTTPTLMNVGLGHDYSITEYYEMIQEVVGWKGTFTFDTSKPVGMKQKLVDTSLQNKIGWQAKHSVQEGISTTLSYFIQHNEN